MTREDSSLWTILDKIAEIEERQVAVLDALASGQQQPAMNAGQREIELRFRALRNMLGNFGRRGEPDVALLPVELHTGYDHDRLVFAAGLPKGAHAVTRFYRDGTQEKTDVDSLVGCPPVLDNPGDVVAVQVTDVKGNPIAFGLIRRVQHGIGKA
ncbi:hypothetical protein [Streptosporangium carneum]|uniref:Uncharacterized protein n=1 Tax=Streptosporangium carneum TaxID=47481 RepID=A0A9W6I6K7_9ACTN|nr:hypothetical protein [Streptosporangium carneum]GLK12991.1 hypothetical protein GCM10017600_64010 [Streptosporangium carneum]